MTGTGTQADPYIITSVDDLYSMDTLGSETTYFELGADLDFNGTPYAEHFSPIPLKCLSFDGKGHSISNIFVSDPNGSVTVFSVPFSTNTSISVKNTSFSNTRLVGNSIAFFNNTGGSSCTLSLYNCTFFIDMNLRGSCCVMSNALALTAELCSFSYSGILNTSSAFFSGAALSRCHFHLDLMQLTGPYYGFNNSDVCFFAYSCTVTDSYITGEITGASGFSADGAACLSAWQSSFSNFYSALAFTNIPHCMWDGTYNYACFYDRENAGMAYSRIYYDEPQVFLPLTTAQCKDAAYLQSIGFVVEGGD